MTSPQNGDEVHPLLARFMPRHAAFYAALVFGLLVFAASAWWLPKYALSLGANGMFCVYLLFAALRVPRLSPEFLRQHAKEEDTPPVGIFFITFVVVAASLAALFGAINSGGETEVWLVVAGVSSVLLGWFTVQAMAALHYAYEYYQDPKEGETQEGGLDFPGHADPNGFDFVYFSFTVGTSVATSDVKVSEQAMRRMVTVHMVFSHFFNTIILAAAVNVLFSLGTGGG